MTKLSPTHRDLLAAIAADPTGAAPIPDGARNAVRSLIKQGLLMAPPEASGGDQIMITEAGRAAIGQAVKAPGEYAPTPSPASTPGAPVNPTGKIGALVNLLRRAEGARIEEMMTATGWQTHSVRGAISGSIKKRLGLTVSSNKIDGARVYRIVEQASA